MSTTASRRRSPARRTSRGTIGSTASEAEAALLRALASDFNSLPTATELTDKFPGVSVGKDGTTVADWYGNIDALGTQRGDKESEVIDECIRRLRTSGDGGEADLDQTLDPGARIMEIDGWEGEDGKPEWVLPVDGKARSGRSRMLFLHGGGYQWYSPSHPYRPLTTRLASCTGLPILAIDYRLCPAHPFPAAVRDALYALAWVWRHGPPPDSAMSATHWTDEPADAIFVCGDSAGGGLALAMISAVALGELAPGVPLPAFCDELKLPTALGLISPWTDLTAALPSYRTRAWDDTASTGDPVFSDGDAEKEIRECREGNESYGGGADLADARISPVFMRADLLRNFLPPTLLVVGDAEVMLCDSVELAARACEARVPPAETVSAGLVPRVSLRIYRRMWHVFPMYTEACQQEPRIMWSTAQGDVGRALAPAILALQDIRDWCHLHDPQLCRRGSADRLPRIVSSVYTLWCIVIPILVALLLGSLWWDALVVKHDSW